MRRFSLYSLVFLVFSALTLGVILSVYYIMNKSREELVSLAVEEKTHLAEVISGTIGSDLWQSRRAIVSGFDQTLVSQTLNFEDVLFFRMVDSDGNILQSTIGEDFGKTIKDPVIKTKILVVRDEVYQGEPIKVVIYPGSLYRTYWVGFTLKSIEKQIKSAAMRNIEIGVGLSVLVLLILLFIMVRIVRPIKKLTVFSQKLAQGDFDVKADAKSKTEIGELASAFNQMVKDLKESRSALEESKNILEVKVKARTAELEELAANQEEIIETRTKEVKEKIKEIERFNKLAVGRELKMIELKKEIESLKRKNKK